MKCVGVCDSNLLELGVANVLVSSENATYPYSNLLDLNRRKKVWRSSGYWEILDGSNGIVFREFTGVDLLAEVAPGEYTTTELLAAVKAALEVAGACTYTVSLGTLGRIQIASNHSSGDVTQLIWTDAASLDMAEILGFDSAFDSTGANTYLADVLRIHTSEWMEWDLAIPTNPQAFIFAGDRNLAMKISPTATITLQGNPTRNWGSPQVSLTVPYTDYCLAKWDFDGLSGLDDPGCRYWRFKIEDPSNTRQYLEGGAMYLGPMITPAQGCVIFPLEFAVRDPSDLIYSELGQTFSREKPKYSSFSLAWVALKKEEEKWLRNHVEAVGKTRSFFIILDSQQAFSDVAEDWVRLVKFEEDPKMSLTNPNYFETPWELREDL